LRFEHNCEILTELAVSENLNRAMLIIGCGYIGMRVGRAYLDRGAAVRGVVRTPESARNVAGAGIPAIALDLAQDDLSPLAPGAERVFHFAPPPPRGRDDWWTRRLVEAFGHQGHPAKLVYISTTGVYGDCGGAWVDESRPPNPVADRAWRRLDAERILTEWSRTTGADLVILRVAGIYGPGRLPLDRIRHGLPLVREEEAPYSNRIHADDLIEVCVAAMDRGPNGAVYNVCDGCPTTMTDYFFRVADAAGLPRPPVIPLAAAEGQLSAGMLSYMRESRRLSNRRMLEDLGVTLKFPSLAEGLADCLARTEAPLP